MKKAFIIFLCLVIMTACGCKVAKPNNGQDDMVGGLQNSTPSQSENGNQEELPNDSTEAGDGGNGGNGGNGANGEENLGASAPETPLPEDDLSQGGVETPEEKPQTAKYLKSKVNSLRVRSANGNAVMGHLDSGDMLELRGESGDYYNTIFKEKPALVAKKHCEIVEIEIFCEKVESAIKIGASLMGHPYVWGSQRYHWGNGKLNTNFVSGQFDCSALVQYVYYHSNGVLLDVTSRAQSLNGEHVKRENIKRGDLLFFTNESRVNKVGLERIGHVGIYFGENYILHTASDHAVIEPMSNQRWSYYVTARRVI